MNVQRALKSSTLISQEDELSLTYLELILFFLTKMSARTR